MSYGVKCVFMWNKEVSEISFKHRNKFFTLERVNVEMLELKKCESFLIFQPCIQQLLKTEQTKESLVAFRKLVLAKRSVLVK